MTATRTVTAWQATEAINCRYCSKRGRCGDALAKLKRAVARRDTVRQCPAYYPQALADAGYPEDSDRGRAHKAWIESVRGKQHKTTSRGRKATQ